MKKYFVLLLLLLGLPLVFFLTGDEEKHEPPKLVLRVGSECDYIPNSWEETTSSSFNVPVANNAGYYADGYDIQIAKAIARELDYVLEVRKIAWNDLLPALNNGEIDVIFSSMLDTEERRKVAAFSDPYEARKTEYGIIVDSVSPYITATKLSDFKGAKIIGEKGTKLDEVIEQIPGVIHVKPLATIKGTIDCVLKGEVDGAVIDTDTGHFYELVNKNLTLIKFPENDGFKLGFRGVCAGIRKGDRELLHRINLALSNLDIRDRHKIMESVNLRLASYMR